MHHHVYLLWDLLQSSHGEIRVVACIQRLSKLLAGKKLIAAIICIRRAAFSVILAEFVQIVPEQFSHDNQMFLVDKKELKTQSNAMQLSEDLAIALQLPIEQSTQVKYRGLVSESDNFFSGDQPCDRSGRKGLVNRSTGHIANNITAIMRWFCALLCFAMLHWVFGAKRGCDPRSHCNWCTSRVWFHQAIGRKSPLQSEVIHKKDLLEPVLLFINYILFYILYFLTYYVIPLSWEVCICKYAMLSFTREHKIVAYLLLLVNMAMVGLRSNANMKQFGNSTAVLQHTLHHSLALGGCLVVLDDLHAHHLICVQIQALHLPLNSGVKSNNLYNVNFRQFAWVWHRSRERSWSEVFDDLIPPIASVRDWLCRVFTSHHCKLTQEASPRSHYSVGSDWKFLCFQRFNSKSCKSEALRDLRLKASGGPCSLRSLSCPFRRRLAGWRSQRSQGERRTVAELTSCYIYRYTWYGKQSYII